MVVVVGWVAIDKGEGDNGMGPRGGGRYDKAL